MRLPDLLLDADVALDGDDYRISSMRFRAADFVLASMSGNVIDARSAAPRFEHFAFVLEPLDLARSMALLPAGKRPPAEVSGSMRFGMEIDGVVPHRELAAALRPPAVQLGSASDEWAAAVASYSAWLDDWSARLTRKLPFRARMSLGFSDLAYADEKNALEVTITPSLQSGKANWRCKGYPIDAMPVSCGGRS